MGQVTTPGSTRRAELEAALEGKIAKTRERLLEDGVILCVRLRSADQVLEACQAAVRGGLGTLEVTLTTPGALEIIREMGTQDGVLAGAGTVLNRKAVREVAAAGGRFVMSPVCDPEVLDEAMRLGILAIPGTATPTEMRAAHLAGASLVKVFPAGALGGPAYLKAVRGPLGDIPLIPTSGPTSDTIAEYLAAGAVAVGVGGEVFPPGGGFTLESVEAASRRIRWAMDRARGAAGARAGAGGSGSGRG